MNHHSALMLLLTLGSATAFCSQETRNGVTRKITESMVTFEEDNSTVTWLIGTDRYSALFYARQGSTARPNPCKLYMYLSSIFDDQAPGNS